MTIHLPRNILLLNKFVTCKGFPFCISSHVAGKSKLLSLDSFERSSGEERELAIVTGSKSANSVEKLPVIANKERQNLPAVIFFSLFLKLLLSHLTGKTMQKVEKVGIFFTLFHTLLTGFFIPISRAFLGLRFNEIGLYYAIDKYFLASQKNRQGKEK